MNKAHQKTIFMRLRFHFFEILELHFWDPSF